MTTERPTWSTLSLSYPQTSMAAWAPSMAAVYGDRAVIIDGDRVKILKTDLRGRLDAGPTS